MKITISEFEILSNPNDMDLGIYVKQKWFETKRHLEMDKCVVCGKISPYKHSEPIYNRVGYIEGGGQSCFQPNICEKKI